MKLLKNTKKIVFTLSLLLLSVGVSSGELFRVEAKLKSYNETTAKVQIGKKHHRVAIASLPVEVRLNLSKNLNKNFILQRPFNTKNIKLLTN